MTPVHIAAFVAAFVVGWCAGDLVKAVGRALRKL